MIPQVRNHDGTQSHRAQLTRIGLGYQGKRTRHSHKQRQDPRGKQLKQAELELLEQAQQQTHLSLKDLDETGFDCWSLVSYSKVETQKRQEQMPRPGRRVSLIGVWEQQQSWTYGWWAALPVLTASA